MSTKFRSTSRLVATLGAAILLWVGHPDLADAAIQYPQSQCARDAFRQDDMAGNFLGVDDELLVAVYPCGGIGLLWQSPDGYQHSAAYQGWKRLEGGGIIGYVVQPDPTAGTPWGTQTITVKPAEPGYIQVIFYSNQTGKFYVFRLVKV